MGRPSRAKSSSSGPSGGGIGADIRALNSSILLMTQKIKYIVRNEKILGRNLIVLNKKIKTLDEKITLNPQGSANEINSDEVNSLKQQVSLLQAQVEDLSGRLASKEEVKELKYVIDSINPLEFTTLDQVKEMIEKSKDKKVEA
jgi:vacuolar-type H+-ATPase subunit I/STV1